MSFIKNIFGKAKKKEKNDDGKQVHFRSSDSIVEHGRRQSIGFADRTFGEESLSSYARSQGKRQGRGPQSCPGGPSDDTRSVASTRRGNRSVITANHQRYNIDYSPEGPSFHFNRGQRNQRKREYRSELDLSLSDQENDNEMRRREREDHVRVERMEKKMRQYRQRKEDLKEENGRLRDENERLKRDKIMRDAQFDEIKRELDGYRLRTPWMPSYPPSFPQPGDFLYGSGCNSTHSRAETDSFLSSSISQRGASSDQTRPFPLTSFSGETNPHPHYPPFHYSPHSCDH